jgi:DNA-directed RNA polymerase omega subunit
MYNRIYLINEALKKVDSRYRLAVILHKRARLLAAGDKPLVKSKYTKPVNIALEEFSKNCLEWRPPQNQTGWSEPKEWEGGAGLGSLY